MTINYKYEEPCFINELLYHIDKTYSNHYSGGIQVVEYIMSNAETLDYLKGNAIKYIHRYGKKNGNNNEDLCKAVHFIMMMAHYADKLNDGDKQVEMDFSAETAEFYKKEFSKDDEEFYPKNL